MTTEAIIEKVKKLLELQKGAEAIGSLEEAANAAEKVQAILFKYNLELADVSNHINKSDDDIKRFEEKGIYAKKNEGQWIYHLYGMLAKHNLCGIILSGFWDDHMRKRNLYVNIIGTKENVEVVKFLGDMLEERIRILCKRAYNQEGKFDEKNPNAFRRAYYMGAVHGIDTQLIEAKERAMQANVKITALVLAHDRKVQNAISEMFPSLKSGRRSRGPGCGIGGALGYRDGKEISINKGIGGSENATKSLN